MVENTLMIGDRSRGRSPKLDAQQEACLVTRYTTTEDSPEQIAHDNGVTKQTLYNILDRHGIGRRKKENGPLPTTERATPTTPPERQSKERAHLTPAPTQKARGTASAQPPKRSE